MSKTVKILGIDWKVGDVIAEYIAALEEDVRQRGALELDALGKIAGLEAELAKHQWISVDERLPEDFNRYNVIQACHGMTIAKQTTFHPTRNDFNISCITHWKPITLPTQPCQGYCGSCLTGDCKDRTEPKEQSNDK